VSSTVAEWPHDIWREIINDFRREMTGRTNLGKRKERSRHKKRSNRIKSNGSTPFSEQVELEG
jgi:hypothetical protein